MDVALRTRAAGRGSVGYPEEPLSAELPLDLPPGCRFAVCLSHDVDHLGLREHFVDGFLARYAVNLLRQNLWGRFRPWSALDAYWGVALAALGHDRWDVLDELLEAERRAGVLSTFFMPMRKGLGISFGAEARARAVARIVAAGFEVGLHSQRPDDAGEFVQEVRDLEALTGAAPLGVRMHYLRLTRTVFDGAEAAGLRYDTSVMNREDLSPGTHALEGPRLVRPSLLEIPLHVMDSTLFSVTGLALDVGAAREYLRALMCNAAARGRVIVVNLHPNGYSRQEPEVKEWYDALLGELTSRSDAFLTDFRGLLPRIVLPGAGAAGAQGR